MTVKKVNDPIKKANYSHTKELLDVDSFKCLLSENEGLFEKLECLNYTFKWLPRVNVDKHLIRQCLDLVRVNMMDLYNAANFCNGWNDRSKLQMLNANSNFYFLILDKETLIGFLCYRFIAIRECQPITPVCYIYEIQLKSECCGNGLGRLLIGLVRRVANRHNMAKVMCTCIKANTRALKFYYKCGFTPDVSDPETYIRETESVSAMCEAGYKILKL